MKKLSRISIAVLFAAALMTSCGPKISKEQKAMEKALLKVLKSPSTYKTIEFQPYEEITLGDEINEKMELFTKQVDFYQEILKKDSSIIESTIKLDKLRGGFSNDIKEFQGKAEEHKQELEKYKSYIVFLNSAKEKYADDLNKVTVKAYVLRYESSNPMGVMIADNCGAAFRESDGKMMYIFYEEEGDAEYFEENDCNIPGYYDVVK